jgi:hypothetical protein
MCTKLLVVSVYARAIKQRSAWKAGLEDPMVALSRAAAPGQMTEALIGCGGPHLERATDDLLFSWRRRTGMARAEAVQARSLALA